MKRAFSHDLLWYLLASGIALILAAVSGMLFGPRSVVFDAFWFMHAAGLIAAAGFGIAEVISVKPNGNRTASAGAALLLAVSWSLSLALGFLPLTARDALIHHLSVPQWWISNDAVAPIQWHAWSFYPMLLQTGFLGLMQHGLTALAPMYHLLYGVILVGVCARLARLLFGDAAALLAAIICALLPAVIKLGSVPLVDLGLAAYCSAALLLFVEWSLRPRVQLLALAGISLGLALSTKYNAILFCACLAAPVLRLLWTTKQAARDVITSAATAGLLAVMVYLPWAAQNYSQVGNPVYPLAQSIFGPPPDASVSRATPLTPLETRRYLHQESWTQIALLPLRVFIFGQDDNPKLFDGRLTPLLLLAIVPLLLLPTSASMLMLGGTSLLYFLLALLLTDTRVRYLAPIFGPLCVLAAGGITTISTRLPAKLRHVALFAVVLFQIIWSATYARELVDGLKAVEYLSGSLSRDQYLKRFVPDYPIALYMNQHLSKDSKTYLVLTGNRFYYFNTPVVSRGHTSANEFISWVKQASSPEALAGMIVERGYTHLLVHLGRLSDLANPSLSPPEQVRLHQFMQSNLTPLTLDRGTTLFEIKPAPALGINAP